MKTSYKIEVIFQDEQHEFFWCIIKITPDYSCNVGHGICRSYEEAAEEAYRQFKNL